MAVTFETLGTLADFKTKDGVTKINRNFKARNKRAVISFFDKKGKVIKMFDEEYESITCSQAVSDDLRDQKITLGQVLSLPVIIASDSEVPYVTYGAGEAITIDNKSYEVAEIEAEEIDIEDFVAL